ncbi:MAG: hypothetical protein NVSMB45_18840 [Ginsengibacter sp.]
MNHFDRYGVVVINDKHEVVSFQEKKYYEEGLINGGTYVVNVEQFLKAAPGEKFSFEKDFMERRYNQETIFGFVSSGYFIDIGIPEDYERAQQELKLV